MQRTIVGLLFNEDYPPVVRRNTDKLTTEICVHRCKLIILKSVCIKVPNEHSTMPGMRDSRTYLKFTIYLHIYAICNVTCLVMC